MKCKECEKQIEGTCDQCNVALEENPIICYQFGDQHFCSQECLLDWLFENGYMASTEFTKEE